ncbi:hypothetical protein HYS48_03770, partial [Candidatus Woesearchaeota archaeon]|nr:hypothetical protein [Candidatus Woesearchaeota archaeon]
NLDMQYARVMGHAGKPRVSARRLESLERDLTRNVQQMQGLLRRESPLLDRIKGTLYTAILDIDKDRYLHRRKGKRLAKAERKLEQYIGELQETAETLYADQERYYEAFENMKDFWQRTEAFCQKAEQAGGPAKFNGKKVERGHAKQLANFGAVRVTYQQVSRRAEEVTAIYKLVIEQLGTIQEEQAYHQFFPKEQDPLLSVISNLRETAAKMEKINRAAMTQLLDERHAVFQRLARTDLRSTYSAIASAPLDNNAY